MVGRNRYYMLISSLPALPVHFEDAERVPISKLRLNERLKMLEEDDAAAVERLADFLVWDRQTLDRTDAEVWQHYEDFMGHFRNALARECVDLTMTHRTIVSALRRRRLKMDPPSVDVGIAKHIANHWTHPDFRLAMRFPWIAEVDAQLNSDTPFELERTLLNLKWLHAKRMADRYQFSFETVLLYLIRWEIVLRWTSRDADAGQQKFERLVTESMGEYANIFEDQSS